MRELVSERLRLRPWRPNDIEALQALHDDPAVLRFFPRRDAEETKRILVDFDVRRERDGVGPLALERRSDGRFLGLSGLAGIGANMPFPGSIQVLWSLLSDSQGFGYATEIGRASLRHGFETMQLPDIVCYCVTGNRASEAVMQRLGFAFEREFDHPRVDPATHPHLVRHRLYRMTHADWQASAPRAG